MIVAHQLSTIKNADQIIFIKDGQVRELKKLHSLTHITYYYTTTLLLQCLQVLERGTHAQLSEKRGAYYKLLQSQTGDKTTEVGATSVSKAKSADDISVQSEAPSEDEAHNGLKVC